MTGLPSLSARRHFNSDGSDIAVLWGQPPPTKIFSKILAGGGVVTLNDEDESNTRLAGPPLPPDDSQTKPRDILKSSTRHARFRVVVPCK